MDYSSEEIREFAAKYFGIHAFRELQEEVISSILSKRDTLAIFPTGGGKSITFQIPAMMMDGLTLVITPIISLMKDQVRTLREVRNIQSTDYISSVRPREENEIILNNLKNIKILYITPERLNSKRFQEILKRDNIKISLVAIDEAHSISLWGNTFRPSYLSIGRFLKNYPDTVIAAFTATATKSVIKDIIKYLNMRSPNIIKKSAKRDNISIRITYVDDKTEYLLSKLDNSIPTVIYFNSRDGCDYYCDLLNNNGFKALRYHAGLTKEERDHNQEEFIKGNVNIITATSAFGMGIDKKDIRRVYHLMPPFEIEEYSQEIGRAGRDGKESIAELILNLDDFTQMIKKFKENYPSWKEFKKIIDKKDKNDEEKEIYEEICKLSDNFNGNIKKAYLNKKRIVYNRLIAMLKFITASKCRTINLLKYFDEKTNNTCKKCDYCHNQTMNINLDDYEIRLAGAIGKEPIDIEKLKSIVKGLEYKYILYPGFSSLKGYDYKDFIKYLYKLANKSIITFSYDGKKVLKNI